MEANIDGHQRKVLRSEVRPTKSDHGASGIPLRNGRSLPFRVNRGWNAPAGNYPETWYLVAPDTNEVLYEGPVVFVQVWGLQSITDLTDEVTEPIRLAPGTYKIVWSLGGVLGGELEVEARELPSEAAA